MPRKTKATKPTATKASKTTRTVVHVKETPGWVYGLIGLAALALLLGAGLVWYNMYRCPTCGIIAPVGAPVQTSPSAPPSVGNPAPAAPNTLPVPPAAPVQSQFDSLNYDESNNDPLPNGQSQLIALYLRIAAPITQGQLENAISLIQQEAAAVNATTTQGSTLTLDQRQAWLVWCSDATQVDPPADVSLVHENSLLDTNTLGRVWIQVPFAQGVPLRSDDTWTGCADFWSVAIH